MLSKESKIRILESFQSIDYTIFGKPVGQTGVCCPFFVEEYLSAKGALLSVMIEMYELMDHKPKVLKEAVNSLKLKGMAKKSAFIARENCKTLVSSEDGRKDVKQSLRESLTKLKDKRFNIDEMVQNEIKRKAYGLAIDNLLVGRAIAESTNYKKMNTWNGRILEDAYKVLRDNLVETAIAVLENDIPEEPKKKVVNEDKAAALYKAGKLSRASWNKIQIAKKVASQKAAKGKNYWVDQSKKMINKKEDLLSKVKPGSDKAKKIVNYGGY